ncbi:hypothetical protein Fmac_032956 [Flemingia macrophylla]|uniref:Uncharacterized protein n=1 Tax=Flemingia macrophylla TaxID=520843 RepID=A0ABD1L6E6_9FABA
MSPRDGKNSPRKVEKDGKGVWLMQAEGLKLLPKLDNIIVNIFGIGDGLEEPFTLFLIIILSSICWPAIFSHLIENGFTFGIQHWVAFTVNSGCTLNHSRSLDNNARCSLCTTKLSTHLCYVTDPTVSNVSDYRAYTAIYAASLSDYHSHICRFHFLLPRFAYLLCPLGLLEMQEEGGLLARGKETVLASGLDSMNQSTTVISSDVEGNETESRGPRCYFPKRPSGCHRSVSLLSLRMWVMFDKFHYWFTITLLPIVFLASCEPILGLTLLLYPYISHKDSDIPDVDLSNVGVTKFGSFIVEVIDPVSDYLELLETAFDFQLIKGLLPRPDFR